MKLVNPQIRELAILFLYAKQLNPEIELQPNFDHLMANRDLLVQEITKDEMDDETFQRNRNYLMPVISDDPILPKGSFQKLSADVEEIELPAYLETIVEGVLANKDALDERIDRNIQGKWSVNRLETINLQILRVAVYEMLYTDDEMVPNVVALAEALELAKLYSDDRSRKFINGVLSNVLKEIE